MLSCSARTVVTAKFFPRFFLLLYTLFHLYIFIYPFGFSYLALLSMVLTLQSVMYFFWYHYELPALYKGVVCPRRPRMVTGEIIGLQTTDLSPAPFHDPSSSVSLLTPDDDYAGLSNTSFPTHGVVLEDEIELSRRIQQQQLADLFLSAEVSNRIHQQRQERLRERTISSPATSTVTSPTRESHATSEIQRQHINTSALSPVITTETTSALTPSRFRRTATISSPLFHSPNSLAMERNARLSGTISDLDSYLEERRHRQQSRSESFQKLFEFASAN